MSNSKYTVIAQLTHKDDKYPCIHLEKELSLVEDLKLSDLLNELIRTARLSRDGIVISDDKSCRTRQAFLDTRQLADYTITITAKYDAST